MMLEAASWIAPLLLIPGVGLLLVSTSARYDALHTEIHQLLHDTSKAAQGCAEHVVTRAKILQTAMFCLYITIMLLSGAGLLGALADWRYGSLGQLAWLLMASAVFFVFLASLALIRESIISLRIISGHAKEVKTRE